MTDFILDKYIITKTILGLIEPELVHDDTKVKEAVIKWWTNIRKDGGLSLTEDGEAAFSKAEIKYYSFPAHISDFSGWTKLHVSFVLDQRIPCPYSIKYSGGNLTFNIYDGRIAVDITLCGSIKDYLDISTKRSDLNK